MQNTESIKERIYSLVASSLPKSAEFDVSPCEKESFGDYATNAALRLSKEQGEPPIALAEKLVREIQARAPNDFFQKIEIAKPGFINFFLSPRTLAEELAALLHAKENYGKRAIRPRPTVIVEYSQPNIAKRMHVGHLRTTVLGDALANLYEFLGYRVIRWNYFGDWGTQFGKTIAAYKLWGKKTEVEKNPIGTLLALYIRFHDEMKTNPELEERGREEFRKLEEGDKENRKLWEWFRKESLLALHKLYKLLGISFDVEIGEAFFEKDMKPLVQELVERGIAKKSEGSLAIPLPGSDLPALVQKADGASLYLTRDIANLRYRIKKYNPAKILYVVGNEQALHFEQLFKVAEILELRTAELVHVKYGLVLGEEGKKFATREGRVVSLEEAIAKSLELARGIIEKKNPGFPKKEKEAIAKAIGIGALKYANLKENRHSDIIFDWGKMLDFSGDSAPYLLYTYSRLLSVLRKAGKIGNYDFALLIKDEERALMLKSVRLHESVFQAAAEYAPNAVADYLYELSVCANKFYETTPILREENLLRRNARLALIRATAYSLKSGLSLLGITVTPRI